MFVHALGGLATALAAVFLIPQISRLMVSRDASGVSMTWALIGVVTNISWVGYLVVQRLWVPALAPMLAAGMYGFLVYVIGRTGAERRWAISLMYSGALIAVASVGGTSTLGAILAVTPVVHIAPELVAVFRHPRPNGVSPSSWALSAAEALCWGAYGILIGDGALVGYGLVTSIGSVLILGRWWITCGRDHELRPSSVTSTRPSRMAVAAASPRFAATSLRKMLET